MFVAVDGKLAGLIAVADPIKTSTPAAIAALHAAGLRIVMATGDGLSTANAVARQLGIDEVHGEVRPADKIALVQRLKAEGRTVAMAGDGINDARSEEHTSELQSLMRNSYAVFCLKKKKKQ